MTRRRQYPSERVEAERRTQEHNATVILRDIMCRERFQSAVRDQLADALLRVAAGDRLAAKKRPSSEGRG
jgi:hypothetical protein